MTRDMTLACHARSQAALGHHLLSRLQSLVPSLPKSPCGIEAMAHATLTRISLLSLSRRSECLPAGLLSFLNPLHCSSTILRLYSFPLWYHAIGCSIR